MGWQLNRYATAAATSAPSVSPSPCAPVLAPVPRKLNLSVEMSCCHKASATADTTLLYMFPPRSGWGWQRTTPTSRLPVASHTRPSNVRSPAGKVTFLSTCLLLTTRTYLFTSCTALRAHRDDATALERVQNVSCAPWQWHVQCPTAWAWQPIACRVRQLPVKGDRHA